MTLFMRCFVAFISLSCYYYASFPSQFFVRACVCARILLCVRADALCCLLLKMGFSLTVCRYLIWKFLFWKMFDLFLFYLQRRGIPVPYPLILGPSAYIDPDEVSVFKYFSNYSKGILSTFINFIC